MSAGVSRGSRSAFALVVTAGFAFWALGSCGGSVTSGGGNAGGTTTTTTTTGAGGTTTTTGSGGTGIGGASGTGVDTCTEPSDCVLRPKSCCGECGAATRSDYVALSHAGAASYANRMCLAACPPCFSETDPSLVATCTGGRCAMVDLQQGQASCATGADCRVRTVDCCECGGRMDRTHLVAVAVQSAAEVHNVLCDSDSACAKCLPIYPPEITAACDQGHCIVK